jgi:hypothetical protein
LISPTTPYGVMNNRLAPLSRPWNKRRCWQLCPQCRRSPSALTLISCANAAKVG